MLVTFCFSQFFQLSLRWPDFCGGGGGGNRTSLTLNPDLVCFLLGELVGFLPPPLPQPGSGSILPSPLQGTRWNLSHLLLRDGAGVCVEHRRVQQQHFGLLWSRVVQFQGMFGFPRIVWIAP